MNEGMMIYLAGKQLNRLIVIAVAVALFASCKKTAPPQSYETNFLSYSVEAGSVTHLQKQQKSILISIGDEADPKTLKGAFQLSPGAVAKINGVVQKSFGTVDLSSPVVYNVEAPDGSSSKWLVSLQPNTQEAGLGLEVTAKKSNDPTFDWYVAQDNTGEFYTTNGGPAAITMITRWADPTLIYMTVPFLRTTVDSIKLAEAIERNMKNHTSDPLPRPGEVFTVTDIKRQLTTYGLPWKIVSLPNRYTSIKNYIDMGYILLLCVDMRLIPYDFNDAHRIQRFNDKPVGAGHYIIVKGYKETDNSNYWLETFDPYSRNLYYPNGGPLKARNRYYHSSSVEEASNKWWDYAIVIGKKGNVIPVNLENVMNPANVPESSGN